MARRRMSAQDSLWLLLDGPENRTVITSLLWTSEPVDPDRLKAVVAERLVGRYPVFGRRPVLGRGPVRHGWWVDDPDFDLDRHVLVGRAPGDGGQEALQRFVGAQRSEPLDPAHPLWQLRLLQGYRGGSALVQRYSHAMADGVRLSQVMLGVLDPADGTVPRLRARVGRRTPLNELPGAAGAALSVLRTAGSAVKIALWTNPASALDGQPGAAKTAAWSRPVPVETLHGLAAATGTTLNDVAVTLVAGAVARFLADADADRSGLGALRPGDDDLAWMVPVNLEAAHQEPPRELGNHFALVLAVLPHGPAAFPDRLAEVHHRMARIRGSWEPMLTDGLARLIARSPSAVGTRLSGVLADKAVGVLTNVPGPSTPMTLAGAPVAGAVGWAPCSGHEALTVCMFGYADALTVGFGTDAGVLPEPGLLVSAFDAELAAAVAAVPLTGPGAGNALAAQGGPA